MAEIYVHRKSERITALFNHTILLNGIKIMSLANGETKKIDLEYGDYSLQAKLFGANSQTINFNISENQTKRFILSSFKNGYWKTYYNLQELKTQN